MSESGLGTSGPQTPQGGSRSRKAQVGGREGLCTPSEKVTFPALPPQPWPGPLGVLRLVLSCQQGAHMPAPGACRAGSSAPNLPDEPCPPFRLSKRPPPPGTSYRASASHGGNTAAHPMRHTGSKPPRADRSTPVLVRERDASPESHLWLCAPDSPENPEHEPRSRSALPGCGPGTPATLTLILLA